MKHNHNCPLYIYLTKLCSEGLHKQAFRIIAEKAQSEGFMNAHELRMYVIRYICNYITKFLLKPPRHMTTFVHDLYMYNNPHYENDTLFMSALIENAQDTQNNLFIQKSISILAQYMTHEPLLYQLANNKGNKTKKCVTHKLCMSHLIKHIDSQDHDILINTFIDKHKDYINTLSNDDDSATGNQIKGMSLLEKAIRLNKKDIVRKLLQSDHINIDTMYNMFKSSQFVTQLYALLSEYTQNTDVKIQEKAHTAIQTLQSITDDHFKSLCMNACGFNSYNNGKQLVSLLKKMTKTNLDLSDSEHIDAHIILHGLKKSKYQKDGVFNMYGIPNARMYARMIYNTKHARDMASQIVRQTQQQPAMNTEDIARYITSYTRD
jgi:hypothetical protein